MYWINLQKCEKAHREKTDVINSIPIDHEAFDVDIFSTYKAEFRLTSDTYHLLIKPEEKF